MQKTSGGFKFSSPLLGLLDFDYIRIRKWEQRDIFSVFILTNLYYMYPSSYSPHVWLFTLPLLVLRWGGVGWSKGMWVVSTFCNSCLHHWGIEMTYKTNGIFIVLRLLLLFLAGLVGPFCCFLLVSTFRFTEMETLLPI